MELIQSNEDSTKENEKDNLEVISTFDVVELEQRFEYDTNVTICHYEWH
ncbi:hypothetical protein R1T43_05760 [Alteromonas sp. CI.11.F.A3]|nr:hypothetical protein [Alteromonas sp. CI.11.F.A3]WOI38537.1 hypothetical protein R1T43_05760 [Alteromonas sp. CI.11.F.A3]